VWCGLVVDQLTGPFVVKGRSTADNELPAFAIQDELPLVLKDVPLEDTLNMSEIAERR
jgi:hypothetical protein